MQTDAIKARKSAAKAFSEALDRRNANLLQPNSKGGGTTPAPADENHPASPPQVRLAQLWPWALASHARPAHSVACIQSV